MKISKKRKLLYIVSVVLVTIYLIWRIFFTIPWQTNIFVLIFALLLVGNEIISNATAFLLLILRISSTGKLQAKTSIPKFMPHQIVPEVDVIIVTHNEELALLQKTINAATFLKYPDKSKVHVVIADDGNRPAVRELAEAYGVQYIGMTNNTEAKSGNINHALKQLHSPLFVIFDADMIPFSTFLEHSVPFFTKNIDDLANDEDQVKPLGFLQTPQSFYHVDIFQHNLFSGKSISNEQDFFSRDINVLNGANDGAIFTGSNAIFLRQAVDEAGGFPTDTLTEDFELGAKINIAGYASISTILPESAGTTPLDVKGVIKQRVRWGRGVMQSTRNLHIFTNPNISFMNRVILINSYLYWWSFARRLVYIAAPVLYALFKVQVVNANFWLLLVLWAPGYFLLHYALSISPNHIRTEFWGEVQETFFAPYLFIPIILETLGIKAKKFKVTIKNAEASIIDRIYVLPHLILWIITLFAIVKFNYGKWGSEIMMGSIITFWLLLHFANLTFSIFVALNRTNYRNSERFARKTTGKIYIDNGETARAIEIDDLSESGILFHFASSKNGMAVDQDFSGILYYENQPIEISGSIIRILIENKVTLYGATMSASPETANRHLQLIYDGTNKLLPSEQDGWITPFDTLQINLQIRGGQWRQQVNLWRQQVRRLLHLS